ncbi:RNA-directed DNA polymerase [Pseudoalteromonas sp. S4498]|uniref:reverse transcriptase family protein n=1 Tax=Pseudoalteromonas galatheae TaxID=579562 RepID=UPI0011094F9E|nr:reverse transcriptase family protein [Pseudoalteromonas galatheae]NKC19154.1 RNA-directed DNA polymerase [Pseudoalteromonas galatheae]
MKKISLRMQEWELFFKNKGVSTDLINIYLPYIEYLESQNLPVVFEAEHLSNLLGIKPVILYKMVSSPSSFYRSFDISKKKGGKRRISSPYPSLLICQKWIYENILMGLKTHYCAHGYIKSKSIVSNAKAHLNERVVLKMDLQDFFDTITINWVINLFSKLGYANNVSYILASLCCFNGALPQGAATSPALSNILLVHLDMRIYRLAKKYSLTYTRYADDLTFSGNYIPHTFIEIVNEIIVDFGLNVNKQKTKLIIGNKQKIVTGISVKNSRLQLPRKTRRTLKQELFYIKKYGLISHISKLKIKKPNYLDSLQGKFAFWTYVEPHNEFARHV